MITTSTRYSSVTKSAAWDLFITRFFDAPRELVFKAWIDS